MPEVRGSRGTAPETIPRPSFRVFVLFFAPRDFSLPSLPSFSSLRHVLLLASFASVRARRKLPTRKIPLSSPPSYLLLRRLHSHSVEHDSRVDLRALDNIRSVLSFILT